MAQKRITQLQLRSSVSDDCNIPVDDGTQSYRVTALQFVSYILSPSRIVRSMITPAERIPTGVALAFGGTVAPTGYLLCDGSAISRTTYADLFAAIGTVFGVGNGTTTFNLPNTSGVFIQGAGSQTISSKSFAGTLGVASRDSTASPVTPFTTGTESSSHSHAYNQFVIPSGSQAVNNGGNPGAGVSTSTGTQSANHTHSVTGGGDTVTKPGSIAFNHIMKY